MPGKTKPIRQPTIRLEVTVDPEDPSKLALELADAMQSELNHGVEIRHYQTQIQQERNQLKQLTDLAFQIRKLREGGYKPTRRMDPLAEYDLKQIEGDIKACKDRASKYGEIVKEQQALQLKAKNSIPRIQKRLREAREAILAQSRR